MIYNDKFENIEKSINILIKEFDELFCNYFFVNRNKNNNFCKMINSYLNEIKSFFVWKKFGEIYIDILELFFKLIPKIWKSKFFIFEIFGFFTNLTIFYIFFMFSDKLNQ